MLNRPEYAGAPILIAGPNFGIGSSREHAVWALTDYGFQAVISPRFGDIFRNNATKTGLVPVVVAPEFGEALMRAVERDPLVNSRSTSPKRVISADDAGLDADFPLDDFTRIRLLEGLDDIGLTLETPTRSPPTKSPAGLDAASRDDVILVVTSRR